MLTFLKRYGANYKFSQNSEEGVLLEVARRLEIEKGSAAEVGGSDGLFCSNTALLIERGWSGVFVESNYSLYLTCVANWAHRKDVKCICSRVDEKNINAFVDDSCDALSVDTDGPDYQIFSGLKAKPKIAVVEIDSGIPPDVHAFNTDGGASYRAMVALAVSKGYFVLCHTGNLILVDRKYRSLFPEITGDPLANVDLYFNRGWLKEDAA